MNEFTPEERAARKKAVFDAMAPRRQKHILRRGFDKWDPFLEPKDPIEIRRDSHPPHLDSAVSRIPLVAGR